MALTMLGEDIARQHLLLTHYGSAEAFFDAVSNGSADDGLAVDRERVTEAFARAEREMEFLDRMNYDALLYTSDEYPDNLRPCADAPLVLYRAGHCNLNNGFALGVVGTRHATEYGRSAIDAFVHDLTQILPHSTIVSGLAYGADIAAHRAALKYGLPTVAVVAHGLDTLYPPMHKPEADRMVQGGGAIVTEFPTGTRPFGPNFLQRNRIIAGLSHALLVVESARRGGSLNTVKYAISYSRSIYAFPGRLNDKYSEGTNHLIATRQATLTTGAEMLLRSENRMPVMEQELPLDAAPALTDDQQLVVKLLTEYGPLTIDVIAARIGFDIRRTSALLSEMVFDDLLLQTPGNVYALPVKIKR